MKTSIVSVLCFIGAMLFASAGTPAIKVTEQHSNGESKVIGSVSASDDAARGEIIKLWAEANQAFPKDRRDLIGPDASFVKITITNGEETMTLRSWHPLYEHGDLVVTSHGVESLRGRKREDVLKSDKEWYQEARRVFDRISNFTKSKAEPSVAPKQ